MLLSHVCHVWRHYVGISWSTVELVGPELPRQLSWLRKQPCQDILQVRVAIMWPVIPGAAQYLSHGLVLQGPSIRQVSLSLHVLCGKVPP